MKALVAAGLIVLGSVAIAPTVARAEDSAGAVARGAVSGAAGDPEYGDRDGYREPYRDSDGYRDSYGDRDNYRDRGGYRGRDDYSDYDRRDGWRDRGEGRRSYGGDDCRTITIERDDGSVRRIRRCD